MNKRRVLVVLESGTMGFDAGIPLKEQGYPAVSIYGPTRRKS